MRWPAVLGGAATPVVWALLPGTAFADNCSYPFDCFATARAATAAGVGLGIFAALVSGALDFVPLVGTVKGVVEAWTGEDLLTGEELAWWERVLGVVPVVGGVIGGAVTVSRIARAVDHAADAARVAYEAADAVRVVARAGDAVRAADRADEAVRAADAPGAARSFPPGFPDYNPAGGTVNCGRCADAVDRDLARHGFQPAPPGPPGWPKTPGTAPWSFSVTAAGIEARLLAAGDGARGVVYVRDSRARVAHVFNAVNLRGRVVAIDGQSGVYGSIADVAADAGYTGAGVTWGWLPTFP